MTNCRDTKGSNIHYEYNQINNLAYIQKILYGENENNYTDSNQYNYFHSHHIVFFEYMLNY